MSSDMRKFLATVLPVDGIHWVGLHTLVKVNGRTFWNSRAFRDFDDLAYWAERMAHNDHSDMYVCMGAMHAPGATKRTKSGREFLLANRKQENLALLKGLWIDIDVKAQTGYTSTENAFLGLVQFLKYSKLPRPTSVVLSGSGGMHVHWVFDKLVTRDEWWPLASGMVALAQRSGLLFDAQCSKDSVRILRVPDSLNWKTDPPRHVHLKMLGDTYSFDYLAAILTPHAAGAAVASSSVKDENDDLRSGMDSGPNRATSLDTLDCAFIQRAIATGGNDFSQPMWNLTNLLATFGGGLDDAIRMAKDHPDFTVESTSAQYQRKVSERARGVGWPSCDSIRASMPADDTNVCATCPHYAPGKCYSFKFPLPTAKPELPSPYFYRDDFVCFRGEDEEKEERLINYPMTDAMVQEDPSALIFTTCVRGRPRRVTLEQEFMNTDVEMLKALGRANIAIQPSEVKRLRSFTLSWIRELQKSKERVVQPASFGWFMDGGKYKGFCFGGKLHMPSGVEETAHADAKIAEHYESCGDHKPWQIAVGVIEAQHRQEMNVILASAFAAPLVTFTGHNGLILSAFSAGSGVGKTSAMTTAQAVWGNPVTAMQQLSDTPKSVANKIGVTRHLPIFWDELKGDGTMQFQKLVFQIGQGREESRLTQAVTQRKVGIWETLMVCASNDSLMDSVAGTTGHTTAGLYRIFEMTVDRRQVGTINQSKAQRIFGELKRNYGHAGEVYAEYLGKNVASVKRQVARRADLYSAILKPIDEERFWVGLIACLMQGAWYANRLGLLHIDLRELARYLRENFHTLRERKDAIGTDVNKVQDVEAILADYLATTRAYNTLLTNRIPMTAGKPHGVSVLNDPAKLREVHVQIGEDDGIMRIRKTHFAEWCKMKQHKPHATIKALEDKIGAKVIIGARIGGGTALAGINEQLIQIDTAMLTT